MTLKTKVGTGKGATFVRIGSGGQSLGAQALGRTAPFLWQDLDTMEDIGLELSRHIPKMGTIWAPSKNKALTKLT